MDDLKTRGGCEETDGGNGVFPTKAGQELTWWRRRLIRQPVGDGARSGGVVCGVWCVVCGV